MKQLVIIIVSFHKLHAFITGTNKGYNSIHLWNAQNTELHTFLIGMSDKTFSFLKFTIQ